MALPSPDFRKHCVSVGLYEKEVHSGCAISHAISQSCTLTGSTDPAPPYAQNTSLDQHLARAVSTSEKQGGTLTACAAKCPHAMQVTVQRWSSIMQSAAAADSDSSLLP